MCELRKDSFVLKANAENREYLELAYNQATKKPRGDDNNEMNDHQIILSQPNASQCPIRSYKMYLSKLTELPYRSLISGIKNLHVVLIPLELFVKYI